MEACNTIEPMEMAGFVPAVLRFKMDGWRVVQICAARLPEGYELSYSFGKGYDMRTLRLTVGENEKVPSITQIYPGAFFAGERGRRAVRRPDRGYGAGLSRQALPHRGGNAVQA